MIASNPQTLILLSTFGYVMTLVLFVVSNVTCEMLMKHLLLPDRSAYSMNSLHDWTTITKARNMSLHDNDFFVDTRA
jgi:hypothetical protein